MLASWTREIVLLSLSRRGFGKLKQQNWKEGRQAIDQRELGES